MKVIRVCHFFVAIILSLAFGTFSAPNVKVERGAGRISVFVTNVKDAVLSAFGNFYVRPSLSQMVLVASTFVVRFSAFRRLQLLKRWRLPSKTALQGRSNGRTQGPPPAPSGGWGKQKRGGGGGGGGEGVDIPICISPFKFVLTFRACWVHCWWDHGCVLLCGADHYDYCDFYHNGVSNSPPFSTALQTCVNGIFLGKLQRAVYRKSKSFLRHFIWIYCAYDIWWLA